MQSVFREDLFVSRRKLSYEANCLEIKYAETETERSELQKNYVINKRSYFANLRDFDITHLPHLRDFDITTHLPQDILHISLQIVLLSYIKSNDFTLEELNYEIINFDFGYFEIGHKFGPLHESVFTGDEGYKLKYNAAQPKFFLRLLYLLSNFVNQSSAYYTFLIQMIKISQTLFSPVIFKGAVTALEVQIEQHLKIFKQLFPNKNIIPKQHYGIPLPSLIISLGPPTRASRFSCESTHNCFKELAQKQNFKNLLVSLAKHYRKTE